MKIGLVTWYNTGNYGTALQAYSLYKTINRVSKCVLINEFDYEALNNKNGRKKIKYVLKLRLKFFLHPVLIIKQILRYKNIIKGIKFYIFFKKINQFTVYSTFNLENKINSFDKIIVGSDQVWNPNYINPFYLLNFSDIKKKYSYASSFGVISLSEDKKSLYKKLLCSFRRITVRESFGIQILQELDIGKNVIDVLDPVFLIEPNEWRKFYGNLKKNNKRKYIFCYFLTESDEYLNAIEKIQEQSEVRMEIIQVSPIENPKYKVTADCRFVKNVGPTDFLSYIDNATFVVTDSFHAMAFSIIFNKEFVVFNKFNDNDTNSQNSRIYSLLSKVNLNSRLYNKSDSYLDCINYEYVNTLLKKEILKSESILEDILND